MEMKIKNCSRGIYTLEDGTKFYLVQSEIGDGEVFSTKDGLTFDIVSKTFNMAGKLVSIEVNMEMKRFYFTFGTDERYPFKGGWIIVKAKNLSAAINAFRAYFPNREESGLLNCSDYYDQTNFILSRMFNEGNLGSYCHGVISLQLA